MGGTFVALSCFHYYILRGLQPSSLLEPYIEPYRVSTAPLSRRPPSYISRIVAKMTGRQTRQYVTFIYAYPHLDIEDPVKWDGGNATTKVNVFIGFIT